VRLGDMTTEAVDCTFDTQPACRAVLRSLIWNIPAGIVNAANSSLDHASGLAGAIVKKGSQKIQSESDEWVAKHGRLEEGGVAVTSGGYVF
jgi:hypothetical protein